MSALPEDAPQHEDGIMTNLFAATENLQVSHQGLVSCATNVDSQNRSYVIKTHFCQDPKFPSSPVRENDPVYCVYSSLGQSFTERWSGSADDRKKIRAIAVPDDVHELCTDCFSFCSDLRYVTFGASSKLERICDSAFWGT